MGVKRLFKVCKVCVMAGVEHSWPSRPCAGTRWRPGCRQVLTLSLLVQVSEVVEPRRWDGLTGSDEGIKIVQM